MEPLALPATAHHFAAGGRPPRTEAHGTRARAGVLGHERCRHAGLHAQGGLDEQFHAVGRTDRERAAPGLGASRAVRKSPAVNPPRWAP